MKLLVYFIGLLGLYTLPQCTDDNRITPSDTIPAGYFPNNVGYQWVYKVTDSLKNVTDTVTVTIKGKMTDMQTGQTFKVWQYKWPERTDTAYVETKEDTVRFYIDPAKVPDGCFPIVSMKLNKYNKLAEVNLYVLPFSPGQKTSQPGNTFFSSWIDPHLSAFTYMNTAGSIVSDTSFAIYTGSAIPNTQCRRNELFVPHIGMIQQTIKTGWRSDPEAKYQSWKLLYNNFSVKKVSEK